MTRHAPIDRIIVIVGPTASGKSAKAVKLARKVGGEIISADSRQVYKYLTIGSGKILKHEMRGIPHHLLDVIHPKDTFTANDFVRLATHTIKNIVARGKIPIIVGGTGFYINALLYKNAIATVKPNPLLRKKLGKLHTKKLFVMLKKLDPIRARSIDRENPRRLIRALEIIKATGKPVPVLKKISRYRTKIILLKPPNKKLKNAISKRVDKMIARGLIGEVHQLVKLVIPEQRIREFGFEYSIPLDYIKKQITKIEMREKIKTRTFRYAKRQMTYLRKHLL